MSIISTFKSFERYLKTKNDTDTVYQLVSERTAAKDIIFEDKTNLEVNFDNLENRLGGISIKLISESDYQNLQEKDSSTLYLFKTLN